MTTELNALLSRVEKVDPATASDLRRHVSQLSKRNSFGLVFERHLPEQVELTGRPVSLGDKVHVLPARGEELSESAQTCIVSAKTGARVQLTHAETGKTMDRSTADVVAIADFRDPIYPGLQSTAKLGQGGETPWHVVINGENYHALEALRYTHADSVDLIYIDPPYNTGKSDWIYNDRHVVKDDVYRHSKWLAFMERRLLSAKELLKQTGVIIVAIGDDEHHRLRMLMDQIFGTDNFISDVVWQGGRKNDPQYVSNGADYMLIYARDEETLGALGIPWRAEKIGLGLAQTRAKELLEEYEGDAEAATKAYRKWVKEFSREEMPPSVARYNIIEPETGRLHRTDLDLSWPGGGGPRYDVLHPFTGKPCKVPSRGWIYSDPSRFQKEIDAGRVVFGQDEAKVPSRLQYLDELDKESATSVFDSPRSRGPKHLENKDHGVFREKRFPNPKDHEVLMRWISLVTGKDAVILDFFGGSGSTMEAVLRLNKLEHSRRQCILVTNNEVSAQDAKKMRKGGLRSGDAEWEAKGVYQYVTRPRIETIVTGQRPDGSTYSDGLSANVEFFDLNYQNPDMVRIDAAYEAVAPLLWMRAGLLGSRIDHRGEDYAIAESYGVLFDIDSSRGFVQEVEESESVRVVYIVTDDEAQYQQIASQLPAMVKANQLYESYLSTFEINTERH